MDGNEESKESSEMGMREENLDAIQPYLVRGFVTDRIHVKVMGQSQEQRMPCAEYDSMILVGSGRVEYCERWKNEGGTKDVARFSY